jgi:aminoglycoside phosphotransferase (APT) family kinase protein
MPPSIDRPTWILDRSLPSIRSGLAQVAPSLADRKIVLHERPLTSDPRYFQSSAVIDGAFVVKFAWSEVPAQRVIHEGEVLQALIASTPTLPIPRLEAYSTNPAMLITRLAEGVPLTVDAASALRSSERTRLAHDLGSFLAILHSSLTLLGVRAGGVNLPPPQPQADTDMIRARFPRLVNAETAAEVIRWCAWVDKTLSSSSDQVLLHGDFHGNNILWDPDSSALIVVVDFETASLGDPAYDFRYLPAQAMTMDLFRDVVVAYQQDAGTTVDLDRVLAWHIRTVLGDALWRTEANVPLPDGGTPSSWVNALCLRISGLGHVSI